MARIPRIEFGQRRRWYTLEHLLREDAEQLPTDIERLEHRAVLVVALRYEVLLEFSEELQVQQVVRRQRLFTHHGLHGLHVLADGIASILKNEGSE